ncbi:hypothetical protein SAMN05444162_1998 [Paenibacillaceae bacterium GAS479]|nr:hypothetical protein SAMN05444162_1998 [Paenibacillaceae bacterium GAS479]
MSIRYEFFKVFLKLSTLTHSLLTRFSKPRNAHYIFKFLVNLLYSIVFSVVTGFFSTIFATLIFSKYIDQDIVSSSTTLFLIPSFIFVCMMLISIININERSFSLPRIVYVFFVTFLMSNPRRYYLKAFAFLLSAFLVLFIISSTIVIVFLSPSLKTEKSIINALYYTATFSLIFTVILYSYGGKSPVLRLYRKFVAWSILLFGIVCLTAIQISEKLTQPFNQQLQIEMVLLLGGLIFTFTGVLDKGEDLLSKLAKQYSKEIRVLWRSYYKENSITVFVSRYKILDSSIRLIWNNGNKFELIFRIIMPIVFFLPIWFLFSKIGDLNLFTRNNPEVWIRNNLSYEQLNYIHKLMPILVFLGVETYFTYNFWKNYNQLNLALKCIGACFLVAMVLILLTMINKDFMQWEFINIAIEFASKLVACGLVIVCILGGLLRAYNWLRK